MALSPSNFLYLPLSELPASKGWLDLQAQPVIALQEGEAEHEWVTDNADVLISNVKELEAMAANIDRHPIAAMTLVQVLRVVEKLPLEQGLTVESLAYATLQAGPEYQSWLQARVEPPHPVSGGEGRPVEIERDGSILRAQLNRPESRNSLSVEMRDALVELFELVITDHSIERLELSGRGGCFSVGGELREFGLTPDSATAHRIRSIHNPSRLLACCADRVSCHLHSACIGSGMELPLFASYVSAAPKTFFQLPELGFGLIPGAGGCVSVSRRIGRQRTAWLALSGKKINAQTALEWGLIDEVLPN